MLELAFLIAVCLANVGLGVFVLLNNTKATLNRIFAGFSVLLAFWSAVSFFEDAHISHALIQLLAKFDFISGSIILYLFLWFCATFTGIRVRILRLVALALAVGSILLTITGQMVSLDFMPNRVKFVEGLGYPAFIILTLITLISGVGLLIWGHHKSVGRERSQLRFVNVGIVLMFVVLITTNVILPNFFDVSPLVTRLGIYGILFFTGFSAYAMIKHRLFDIRLVVARTVAYVLLLTVVASGYGAAIYAISQAFFQETTLSVSEAAIFIALAIVVAFTFQPLRRFFEKITDGIFFRDRYDSQVVLNNVGGILATELYLEPILDQSLQEICRNLRIAGSRFIVLEGTQIYRQASYGTITHDPFTADTVKHLGSGILVADELDSGRLKSILIHHGIRVSLMLQTQDQTVGCLILGDKLSGDIYSKQDLDLLEILRKELALAIVNAKAYEEIAKFNITLQDQILKATARLRAANKNLKVLDKAKDEFISMASHQLGTPLTAITGYLSMAIDNDKKDMTADQKQFIQYALEASERMGAMTSDLLNVSRLSAGRFVVRRETADLVEIARQEINQLKPSADRKGLALSLITQPVPPVSVDISKTRQVIMNFIDNAIYYTETGSIQVKIERHHDAIALTVTDTGMGVPPAEKAKLFTKFYRAGNARSVRPDGTGLGLYLAKRVIEEQGGSLIFESELGKGSTFGFIIPLKADADAAPSAPPAKATPATSGAADKPKPTK